MSYHASLAEKKVMKLLKEIDVNTKIGVVNAVQNVYPYSSSPEDVLAKNGC